MVRRDEVGTGSEYEIENIESAMSQYWETEQEMIEAFEAMLKSLIDLGDGVMVDTARAVESDRQGDDYIKGLGVELSNWVANEPIPIRELHFIEVGQPKGTLEAGNSHPARAISYVSMNLTQFLFKRFGFWWLIAPNQSGSRLHILMFKKKPSQLWYAGGGAVCGRLAKVNQWRHGVMGRLKKLNQVFYSKSPLAESENIQDKIDSIVGPSEYFNFRDGMHKLQMDSEILSHRVRADASWVVDIRNETQFTQNKDEIPIHARDVKKKEVKNGNTYYEYRYYRVKVERDYTHIDTLNLWDFDYDNEYRKQNTYLNTDWFNKHLEKEKNPTKRQILFDPYKEEMTYGEFIDLFPAKWAEEGRGDHIGEVRFQWPTLYQYKTAFGILNHYAV